MHRCEMVPSVPEFAVKKEWAIDSGFLKRFNKREKMNLRNAIFGIFISLVPTLQANAQPSPVQRKPWQQNLESCDQDITWPPLDSYVLTLRDMYMREYACVGENGQPLSAYLTAIESRDCESAVPVAYLTLYWTCP